MTYYSDEAFPAPSDEQWARLQSYGSAQEVESGALPWGAGEATYDLIWLIPERQRSSRLQPRGRPRPLSPVSTRASSPEN